MTDYPILAAPRIRLATFAAVLERASSPAAAEAGEAWAAALEYGVDPAVLLAVFRRESGYGRAGVAVRSRSWGNLRTSPHYPSTGGFVHYPSWAAGGRDTARLLRIYGLNRIRPGRDTSTVRTMPHVWAPTADGNAPELYGRALVAYINEYRNLDGTLAAAPTIPTHACTHASSRIRAAANLRGAIVGMAQPGTLVRASGIVRGGRYRLPDGRTSDRWLRIIARDGRTLGRPVYSAALLWRTL